MEKATGQIFTCPLQRSVKDVILLSDTDISNDAPNNFFAKCVYQTISNLMFRHTDTFVGCHGFRPIHCISDWGVVFFIRAPFAITLLLVSTMSIVGAFWIIQCIWFGMIIFSWPFLYSNSHQNFSYRFCQIINNNRFHKIFFNTYGLSLISVHYFIENCVHNDWNIRPDR